MICVGYVGIEAFDIILYIGQGLSRLKKPVLIIDLSDSGALTKAIHHGMGLDSNNGIVHFAGLSYTRRVPKENILSDFSDGVVLVAYGFNYVDNTLINIDYLNIIMDSLPSNIDKIDRLVNKIPTENMKLKILVRDIVNINDFERARDSIKISNKLIQANYLYLDFRDYENAIRCQRTQNIYIRKTSSRMRRLIAKEIQSIIHSSKRTITQKLSFELERGV